MNVLTTAGKSVQLKITLAGARDVLGGDVTDPDPAIGSLTHIVPIYRTRYMSYCNVTGFPSAPFASADFEQNVTSLLVNKFSVGTEEEGYKISYKNYNSKIGNR